MSYYGPQGRRPAWARAEPPAPVYTQAEQRARRRQWLPVVYGRGFDLEEEIEQVCAPLGSAMAGLPNRLVVREEVTALAGAVYNLCSTVIRWLMDGSARDPALVAAVRAFAALERGEELFDAALSDQSWPDELTAVASPFSAPLAELLGRRLPRDSLGETVSDRLVAALRPLDTAAHDLSVRIGKAARCAARGTHAEHRARLASDAQADRIAERLAKLGLS